MQTDHQIHLRAGLRDRAHSATAEIKPGAPDAEIIVFVDRSGVGNQPATGPRGQLSLFSRAVGKLVAYELTPLARPLVLDQLYVP